MSSKANILKEAVINYCALIGSDPMLVQGAGGNVSWKEADTLWVKASGTWLAEAQAKEIFVAVDLDDLQTAIKAGNFAVTPKLICDSQLRPSIETLLHALMPHRVVIHLHAIEPLVHLVRYNSELEISEKLKTEFNWKIVSYHKPGEALAKAVADAVQERPEVDILLLQNHGVVIGGSDVEEVNNILNQLLSNLYVSPIATTFDIPKLAPLEITGNHQYLPVHIPGIHSLAFCPEFFGRIKTEWALYPDHVVFLGRSPYCYDSLPLLIDDINKNIYPELIFLKGQGVFAKVGFSLAKQAQLQCYYDVIVRQPKHAHLKTLDEQQIAELLNWDAEHYRQQLARQ
jgi:rhamnose utilization protein RhaD (predicted bifunctional aldolase and dehydrogenase)